MRVIARRALRGLSLTASALTIIALAVALKASRKSSDEPGTDGQRVRNARWIDRHAVQDGTSHRRSAAIGVALALFACALGFLGYRWTRSTPPPPSPIACVGRIDGRCHEEQSGVYLYVSDPAFPVALNAFYGKNIFG